MTNQTHADWLRAKSTRFDLDEYQVAAHLRTIADELEAKDRTIAALTAERDRLREALAVAQHTIEGLVDQQAMPDDWYEEPLQMVVAALANGEVKE